MLSANDVVFGYGSHRILDSVGLEVVEGSLTGLVGPNGAGKSTLLRCLYGSLVPQSGRVVLDGEDLADLGPGEIARRIGVVPQTSNPAFPVTVAYFVGMGRFAREPFLGGPTGNDRDIVRRCIEEMRLTEVIDQPVDELSGGEFRRVLLAQALAQEPRLLLLDEPVQQLDLLHQLEVMAFVRDFTRRGGTAGVVVLHDLSLAARYCDTVALLSGGQIVASGPPASVLTADNLRTVYGVESSVEPCPDTGGLRFLVLRPAARASAAPAPGRPEGPGEPERG